MRHQVENTRGKKAPTPHARKHVAQLAYGVEYARTFFMSLCTKPIVAAKKRRRAANDGDDQHRRRRMRKKMCERATTYTPACHHRRRMNQRAHRRRSFHRVWQPTYSGNLC